MEGGSVELVERPPVAQVLSCRETAVEPALSTEHDADARTNCRRLLHHVVAEHPRPSRGGQQYGGQDLDEGRLASSVGPEQPHDFARVDGQRHVAQGDDLGTPLSDPPALAKHTPESFRLDGRRHRALPGLAVTRPAAAAAAWTPGS